MPEMRRCRFHDRAVEALPPEDRTMKCIGGTIVDGPTLEMNERGWPASIAVDGYLFEFVEVVDILRQEIKRQNSVKQDPPWNAIVNGTPATLTLDARVAAVENNVDTLRARASDAEVTSRNIRTDVAAVTKKTDGMYHSLAQQGDVIESLARKVAGIETTILKNHF